MENIYHCTVHKAGSQWIKTILFDPQVYQYSGLKPFLSRLIRDTGIASGKVSYPERLYRRPFPTERIITPLYANFESFCKMPKSQKYRAFFIMRDPRDISVSYYYSVAFFHTPMGDIPQKRKVLRSLDLEEGICWTIKHLKDYALYDALRSWKGAGDKDPNVLILRLEDLAGSNQVEAFKTLLAHCDIALQGDVLRRMLERYSFKQLQRLDHTGGHYRSSKDGAWRRDFTKKIEKVFMDVTGDLVEDLGYEW
jgi:hypothetical protein